MRKTSKIFIPLAVLLLVGAMSLGARAQERVDRDERKVELSPTSGSVIFVRGERKIPYFYFDGETVATPYGMRHPTCDLRGMKGFFSKYWGTMASYLDNVAAELEEHPDSDWGWAWTSISATQASGFCNIKVSTRGGQPYLTLLAVQECFGTAGCNDDIASFSVTEGSLKKLATALREEAP